MDNESPNAPSMSPSGSQGVAGPSTGLQDDPSSSTDDKRLARQKRKRTSPDDQAVLEAAYKLDAKPDKAARLQLVEQVALGEKEVQIWFQNRRQSCRRKSGRPLLPHEIAQYQMAKSVNAQLPGRGYDELARQSVDPSIRGHSLNRQDIPSPSQSASEEDTREHQFEPGLHQTEKTPVEPPSQAAPALLSAPQPMINRAASISSPMFATSHIGHLANRRSATSLHRSFSETAVPLPPSASCEPGRPRKKSNAIRLSMNAEGNAIVTTQDTSSPSPPRPSQAALLPAIHSKLDGRPLFTSGNSSTRPSNGRSRDSRSWEFWCDKDARSELEGVAEKESHGSATGAIGLLRTSSGRSVLSPLSAKRNAPLGAYEASAKRTKRRSLMRSQTALARLQGRPDQAQVPSKLKKSGSASTKYVHSGESDKENWSPVRDLDFDDAALESRDDLSTNSTLRRGGTTTRSDRSCVDDPEADPELSSFMAQGRKRHAPAGEEELDCVQGLLSLSQGNWAK